MASPSRSYSLAVTVLVVLGVGYFVWWLAVTPNNLAVARWRARHQELTAKVIVGPYPLEKDFATLRRRDVKLVISLLNPDLPYEKVLLERERLAARSVGIPLVNFPMTSLWGREVGDQSAKNAQLAAEAARNARGRVYLHCYLGIHRARRVANLLGGTSLTSFQPREMERPADRRALDEADAAYAKGNYQQSLRFLNRIQHPDSAAWALRGWANFKSGHLQPAGEAFRAASFAAPADPAPLIGLGYVFLRENDLHAAEESFRRALVLKSADVDALTGSGIVAYRQGRNADAIASLQDALSHDPKNAEAAAMLETVRAVK